MTKKLLFATFIVLLMLPLMAFVPYQQAAAPAAQNPFTITCETGEEIVVSARITLLNVNPEFGYRISAVGINSFDPIAAIITEPGVGRCNDNTEGLAGSQLAVPGIGFVEANALSSQFVARTPSNGFADIEIVVGGLAGSTGEFALVIEGLRINPEGESDQLLVSVPESATSEALGVFMIGRPDELNPFMRVFDGTGAEAGEGLVDLEGLTPLATCDDAGTSDCFATPTLNGGGVALSSGTTYVADGLDTGLIYTPRTSSPLLYAFSSSQGESGGDYVVVITGTAPGDPTNPSAICNNVAEAIERVSSNYSSDYLPENLLDNDPTTGWATTVGLPDPATGQPAAEEFVVVRLNGLHRVNQVRLNTYSPTEGFRDNSIRAFSIAVQNADAEQVTVFNGEAPLQPGYRTYSFLPIEINMIALVFKSNYGGQFYEVADIQVCAAD